MGLGLCLNVEEATGVIVALTFVVGTTGLTLLEGNDAIDKCEATNGVEADVIDCEFDKIVAVEFVCWSLGLIQGNPVTDGVFKFPADVETTGVWKRAAKKKNHFYKFQFN